MYVLCVFCIFFVVFHLLTFVVGSDVFFLCFLALYAVVTRVCATDLHTQTQNYGRSSELL